MPTPSRPNILLITDDQHRWDFYGSSGAVPTLRTPGFDRLQAEGATLINTYSNCPICVPSRFTWYSGLYASQGHRGLTSNGHAWPEHVKFMPQSLQRLGYHTAVTGKIHWYGGLYSHDLCAYEYLAKQRGFDDVFETCGKSLAFWIDCNYTHYLAEKGLLQTYRNDLVWRNDQLGGQERYAPSPLHLDDTIDALTCRKAVDWLRSYEDDRPFFLHVSFCNPHFPIDPPPELFDHYRPEDMPAPIGVTDPALIRQYQEIRAAYAALVELVDLQIQNIFSVLEDRGLIDNTVILFVTDHGDLLGDLVNGQEDGFHLVKSHKGLPYDGSCRTPIFIWYPKAIPAGIVLDEMAEHVDIPVTLLEIAGMRGTIDDHLPQTPGKSLWSYVTGKTNFHRSWAYSETGSGERAWRMATSKDWKYVWYGTGKEELFDRRNDPREVNNLAVNTAYTSVLGEMRLKLIESLTHNVAPDSIQHTYVTPKSFYGIHE
jgi:arylsulfatase